MGGQSAASGYATAGQGGQTAHASITYHPSQLTPELSKKLKKFLLAIKNGEQSIETQRQRVCAIETFEPLSAFQRIDRNMDMELAPLEIVRFLRENGVENISEADCSNMISYYRGQMQADEVQLALGFKDFLAIVVPLEAPALKEQVQQRPRTYDPAVGGYLDPRVERALAELLEMEILYHRLLETQKQ